MKKLLIFSALIAFFATTEAQCHDWVPTDVIYVAEKWSVTKDSAYFPTSFDVVDTGLNYFKKEGMTPPEIYCDTVYLLPINQKVDSNMAVEIETYISKHFK